MLEKLLFLPFPPLLPCFWWIAKCLWGAHVGGCAARRWATDSIHLLWFNYSRLMNWLVNGMSPGDVDGSLYSKRESLRKKKRLLRDFNWMDLVMINWCFFKCCDDVCMSADGKNSVWMGTRRGCVSRYTAVWKSHGFKATNIFHRPVPAVWAASQ